MTSSRVNPSARLLLRRGTKDRHDRDYLWKTRRAWPFLLIVSSLTSGCALPVTRSLTSTHGYHQPNMWGDDVSRTTVIFQERVGLREELPPSIQSKVEIYLREHSTLDKRLQSYLENGEVAVGMDKEQVKLIMGEPDKILAQPSMEEAWVYYRPGIRQVNVIGIPIPVGRNHYKFVFSDTILQEILLETTEYF